MAWTKESGWMFSARSFLRSKKEAECENFYPCRTQHD